MVRRLIKIVSSVPVCTSFELPVMYVIYYGRCSPPYHTMESMDKGHIGSYHVSLLKPFTREPISYAVMAYHIPLRLKSTTMLYRVPLRSTSKSTNQIKSILVKILKKQIHFVLYIFAVNVVGWSRSSCICFASRDLMVY